MHSPPPAPPVAHEFYRPGSYQPEESTAHLMRSILVEMADQIDRELEPFALTNAQWLPLFKLDQGQANTATALARECRMDCGAMTRMLDRLAEKGLVQRVRSAQDRRIVHVELTPEGRATAQRIPEALCRVQNAYLRGFQPHERDALLALLRRVLHNAQAFKNEGVAAPAQP